MADTKTLEKLCSFVQNNGLLNKNIPPKPNEPFYDFYIETMIHKMKIGLGDMVSITCDNENKITGRIINDIQIENGSVDLLLSGKKVWKSRKNVAYISLRNIIKIEKLSSAEEDFNILEANPEYQEQENMEFMNHTKDEDYEHHFATLYPSLNVNEMYSVCIHSSLYCPFTNADVIKGNIVIITKDDDVQVLKDLRMKHIVPNRSYYNLCSRVPYSEYVIIPFGTYEELSNVRCIATFWTALIDDMPVHTLEMTYPKFVKDDKHKIYNIQQESTFIDVYYNSLQNPSVFSGKLYSKYDFVSVLLNENKTINVVGDNIIENLTMADVILAIHDGSLTKILMSLCDSTRVVQYVEVYKSTNEIKASSYVSDMQNYIEYYEKLRKRLDFVPLIEA